MNKQQDMVILAMDLTGSSQVPCQGKIYNA